MVMLIWRHQEVYGNNIEMNPLWTANNNSISFKFTQQITEQTGRGGIKNVEIMVPLKYLSNFCRTLEMSLINYEVNL